jgi:hypothetical protein
MTTSNFRALASFIRRSSARPGILTTADSFVAIFLDDLEATMGRIVAQCDSLSLCSLAVALGTDSHVEGCAFHCCPLAQGRCGIDAELFILLQFRISHQSLCRSPPMLRTDLHLLYDGGYVTVSPDLRLEVSPRLKQEFDNGRAYYEMVGKRLIVPPDKSLHPSESALLWHAENVYRRHRISLTPLPNNRTSCLWIPPLPRSRLRSERDGLHSGTASEVPKMSARRSRKDSR